MKKKGYPTEKIGSVGFIGGLFFICNVTITLNAGVFFQDDFSDVSRSYKNWVMISASDSLVKFPDGHMEMINTSSSYFSLAIHTIPKNISDYTFAATVSSANPGAGLYFGFTEKEDGYYGFSTFVDEKSIYLYKLDPDSSLLLANIESPFIKPVENRLCVSKSSGRILLFCNGFFLFSIPDSMVTDGSAGFVVQPSNRAVFDNVVMTDTGADSMSFAPFHDEFQDTSSFGWTYEGNALVKRGDGLLNIETNFSQRYCSGLELSVRSFQMKAVVSFEAGDSSSFYGFYCKGADPNSPYYLFAVTADGQYTSGLVHTFMEDIPVSGIIPGGVLRGKKDSLVLIFEENGYKFLVNDRVVSTKEYIGGVHETGLFVSKRLHVNVFGFHLENYPSITVASRNSIRMKKTQPQNTMPIIYTDFLGRKINSNTNLFYTNQILVEKEGNKAKNVLKLGNMLR